MFFWNRRLNNVDGQNDGTLELELWILGMSSAGGPQLRNRPAAFQDDQPLSGSLHSIEDCQASSLEVGCIDGFHMTSFGDQADDVKPSEAAALGDFATRTGRVSAIPWPPSQPVP